MQLDLQREQETLKKRQADILSNMQKEFDNDKNLRKEKFSMQISKFMQSGQSIVDWCLHVTFSRTQLDACCGSDAFFLYAH